MALNGMLAGGQLGTKAIIQLHGRIGIDGIKPNENTEKERAKDTNHPVLR